MNELRKIHTTTCRLCGKRFDTSALDELPVIGESDKDYGKRMIETSVPIVMAFSQHIMQKHPQDYMEVASGPGRMLGGYLTLQFFNSPDQRLAFSRELARQQIHELTRPSDSVPDDDVLLAAANTVAGLSEAQKIAVDRLLRGVRDAMLGKTPQQQPAVVL